MSQLDDLDAYLRIGITRYKQMTTWRYQDPDGTYDITDAEILAAYFPYWSEQMRKAGKDEFISEARCIEDWVVVHWAWDVDVEADV